MHNWFPSLLFQLSAFFKRYYRPPVPLCGADARVHRGTQSLLPTHPGDAFFCNHPGPKTVFEYLNIRIPVASIRGLYQNTCRGEPVCSPAEHLLWASIGTLVAVRADTQVCPYTFVLDPWIGPVDCLLIHTNTGADVVQGFSPENNSVALAAIYHVYPACPVKRSTCLCFTGVNPVEYNRMAARFAQDAKAAKNYNI